MSRGHLVEIQLLGSPTVRDGSSQRRVAGRQGALLAALALSARQPVSAERLAEVVWGTDPPEDLANALQQRITRLRAVLDPGRRRDLLVPVRGGYVLHVDDGQVDARVFERLSAAGHRELSDGDLRMAEATLRRALGLWRGPALEEFADELWAVGESRRLEELRLAAVEDHADALVGLGEHGTAIAELVGPASRHPLRERLRGQLMRALCAGGRQADALALYDETRRLLADELGVDPGPQLQAVYQQVLSQDGGPAPEPPRTAQGPPGNLPAPHTAVLGRERETGQVTQLLGHTRLLTMTGSGGAGKTTLAVEAARRYRAPRDGTWLAELAPLSSGDAVPGVIAEVLGVTRGGLGAEAVGPAELARALGDKELLLVLDNCEHLLDSVSPLVQQLLAGAAGLQVLATSREPLGAVGEVIWSVPGLGLPAEDDVAADQVLMAPAVTLLVERARAHAPGFVLTDENARAAATLTRRLDGIPLAIELAAARLRVLSLGEVTDGLDDRFRLLIGRGRTTATRHRTLRAALDWSWNLLDEPLRRAWAALAVPAGWFDATMASELVRTVGLDLDALDVVADLVDHSLLTAETGERPARYRMLESIRDYGRERLTEQRLDLDVRVAHAAVVQAALAACQARLSTERFVVDVEGMSSWLDDARAAMQWAHGRGDRGCVQRVAGLLGWLWLLRGRSAEGLDWLDRGLGDAERADPRRDDEAALLWASALRATSLASDAARWGDHAARAASAPRDRVVALVCAAGQRANAGRLADAAEILQECAQDAESVGGWPYGFQRLIAGQLAWVSGDVDTARRHAEAAARLLSASGADWGHVHALESLIEDAALRGDFPRARNLALDGLRICRRRRYPELECAMLVHAGFAAHELGHPEEGARYADHAMRRAAAAGSTSALAHAHLAVGTLARHRGEAPTAQQHLSVAVDLLTEAQIRVGLAGAHGQLAHVAAMVGDAGTAMAHGHTAVAFARQMGDPRGLVLAVEALAGAVAVGEDPEPGVALLAAATAVRAASCLTPVPAEQRDIQTVTGRLHDRLGRVALEQALTAAEAEIGDPPDATLLRLLHTEAAATSRWSGS